MRPIELNNGQQHAMKMLKMWFSLLSEEGDVFRVFGYARNR